MNYNPNEIEAKWQQYWAENQTFKASNNSDKPKYYVLDMFPYPSGAGLHVGHPLGYIASDIVARYKRHQGFNVLHPQGYDSFGLPAEQYAIQTGQHPAITTETNIKRYREQLDKIGFSFDWNREVRTSNPEYYKWTQWIFIQLFNSWYNITADKAEDITTLITVFEKEGNASVKAVCDEDVAVFTAEEWNGFTGEEQQKILLQYRLTYLAETEVNWCPALGTVLANDEIVNGVSERGGHPVVRKKMTQWSMRISAYAERLLEGLNRIDWTESLKESQRNWIGKSVGVSVTFNVKQSDATIEVFTTRADTIFGVAFMTLAPEHDLVAQITTEEQQAEVAAYIEATAKRSERERMADVKTISGVFTGAYAEHPFTKEPIPIWIGDYVLAGYGTGAVMAVPCGDERDYAFANFFKGTNGMPEIKNIFSPLTANGEIDTSDEVIKEEAFAAKQGFVLKCSDFLDGLGYKEATQKVIEELEAIGAGKAKVNYRLRDAVFSRQRYWGEPFPVYYVNGMPQMIADEHLPIRLPEVEKYLPTETGEPPLGNATVWAWDTANNEVVANDKIDHETVFPLELNTMPGWAGSSWYFNRYMDAGNTEEFASQEALNYWKDVDLYIGGSEHATGHLLYSRFWQKFLFDKGVVPVDEYAKKLINQGMILGNSAFVYRTEDAKTLVSKGLIGDKTVYPIHADLTVINDVTNELDIEAFKAHPLYQDYQDAEFILEDGKYIVGREVEKMSKSKYNVVNPDDICAEYGADTLRLYEMFLGPLEQAKPWNTAGMTGVSGFLKKLWRLYTTDNGFEVTDAEPTKEMYKVLHQTIKKATEDIENFSFNTSVSQFMICVNELGKLKCNHRAILEPLAVLVSPYAPHIAEELWAGLGYEGSIAMVAYPKFEEKYLVESSKEYPVSFNGKMRFKIELSLELSVPEIQEIILADERTKAQLNGREPKKVIIVPGKIINIVG
ncbi:leucine--tRNA ligase [Neptunitalea chrysea]|uniref:Leucine--tRNA ligase n=1 Tax=Neptunitalea chrysea TaxID=1647581 RepID=A0A9W6EUH9_9FLAO|nr:leucine--tRNA ligase [Neptunitalea chrysea]GLB52624.1 leucine--tRNA ligase [Neptunitalea chrysea]